MKAKILIDYIKWETDFNKINLMVRDLIRNPNKIRISSLPMTYYQSKMRIYLDEYSQSKGQCKK